MKYYLVQNLMYNQKHVTKHRWYHKIFGAPRLTVATCNATTYQSAKAKFITDGYLMGVTHSSDVAWLKENGYL